MCTAGVVCSSISSSARPATLVVKPVFCAAACTCQRAGALWSNHGKPLLTTAFSELQAYRGVRGAAAAAKVKRERREEQILAVIGQLTALGYIPSVGKVAELIHCAKGTLSMHYKHLFQDTLQ